MNKKTIKGCVALAVFLISLASLSSASCPWFLRGELYNAQCDVEKAVPASAGILANDPQAVAVLYPEDITLDPEYGTIKVAADGSFVYKPAKNIQQGTYVQFKYTATNGKCQAYAPATAKFQIACTCRPNVADVGPICLPITLDEIRDMLDENEIGCVGCGDITTSIDLSDIDLDASGMPIAGIYSYCIKCPGCQAACGQITLVEGCDAEVRDYRFCEGTLTLDELKAMAKADARCIGCDLTPIFDFSNVTADEEGYVTGGSFTGTCGDARCGGSDTGHITVVEKCDCEIEFAIPGNPCSTPAEIEAQIKNEIHPCIGNNCDVTPIWDFPDWPVDESGYVANGIYEYTVTCLDAEGLEGCDSVCTGEVTVTPCPVPCETYAPDISLPRICTTACCEQPDGNNICCMNYGRDQYKHFVYEAIAKNGGGCQGTCPECANMDVIIPDNIDWRYPTQFEYTLICGSGDCTDSDTGIFTLR